MCVLLFHETVLPKRGRIMVEIFFDAFDKTVFDMDNLCLLYTSDAADE